MAGHTLQIAWPEVDGTCRVGSTPYVRPLPGRVAERGDN